MPIQNIYAGHECTIQYIDEDSETGGAGALGTNPTTGLTAIDSSPTGSGSVKEPRHYHTGLGSRITIFHTFIKHEASLNLSGYLQNATFISIFENEDYSYSLIVKSEHEKRNLFEQFLGSKPDTLKVTVNRDEPVSFEAGFICREWRDNKTSFTTTGDNDDVAANMDDNEIIEWTSDNAGDVGKYMMVYGLDTDDANYKREIIGPLATAGVYVTGSVLWSGAAEDVFGVVILSSSTWTDATTIAGTGTIRSGTTNTTVLTLTVGEYSQGVYICDSSDVIDGINALDAIVGIKADAACAVKLMYHGHDTSEDEQYETITMNGTTNVNSANAYRNMVYVVTGLVPNARTLTLDTYQVDPNSSWAAAIGTALYTRRNTTVSRLIYVTGETPTGAINGANQSFTTKNNPIADYDRDGNIDDNGDLITLTIDAGNDLPPTSLDSSTGAITVTTAPVGTIVIDYIYKSEISNLEEATFEISNNQVPKWGQYTASNTSPELARKIEHAGLDVKINYKIDSENLSQELDWLIDLGVITVASGTARIWGIEFKFGTSEAGDFKIWAMDGQFETLDLDIAELDLSEEGIDFIADEFDIF